MVATTTEQASSIGQYHLVIFRLDRQVYGLTIDKVVQIFPMVKIIPLPQMGHLVEGVINVRGKVAPVINVRKPLGLSEARWQLYTPIILVQLGGHLVGLIVDEVLDVQSFSADQVVRTAEILPDWMENSPLLDGLVYLDGLTILLINPEHLLKPVQIQAVLQSLPDNNGRQPGGENGSAHSTVTAAPKPAEIPQPTFSQPDDSDVPAELPQAVVAVEAQTVELPEISESQPAIDDLTAEPASNGKDSGGKEAGGKETVRKTSRSRGSRKAEDRLAQHFSDLTNDMPPAEV